MKSRYKSALFDKGGKVVEAKTLQLELDKNILAENWQIANQTRTSVDQTCNRFTGNGRW